MENFPFGAWRPSSQCVSKNIFYFILKGVFEAHTGPICQIYWDEENRILISGGKDKSIRVFLIN